MPFNEPGKSAIDPKSSLPATISLVIVAPTRSPFHCTSYFDVPVLAVTRQILEMEQIPVREISRPSGGVLIVVS